MIEEEVTSSCHHSRVQRTHDMISDLIFLYLRSEHASIETRVVYLGKVGKYLRSLGSERTLVPIMTSQDVM